MTNEEILDSVIQMHGIRHQMVKSIEEMAELSKELCKYMESPHQAYSEEQRDRIAEEIADVKIMLMQLEMIMNNPAAVVLHMGRKFQRLEEMVLEYRALGTDWQPSNR